MRFRWRPGAGPLLRVVRSQWWVALALLAGVATAGVAACEGRALPLRASSAAGESLIVADIATPLRQLIQWSRSGNPVLLADGGAVRGDCDPTDVIRALATSDARSRAQS